MVLTSVFVLVVSCTWVHGSKVVSQHDVGSPSQKTKNPEDILKHALLKQNLDQQISDANKEVGEATTVKTQKKAKHQSAIEDERSAVKKERQAENAEVKARRQKERAQRNQSAAQNTLEVLEGQTAAIVSVEAATRTLNTANTRLAAAKSRRTQHLNDVKRAGEALTLAIERKEKAELAENQASMAASKAALDLQTTKHHHTAAETFCQAAKAANMPPPLVTIYCSAVDMTAQAVKDAEDEKKAADDAWDEAKKEEQDAVDGLEEAHQKKNDLDKETGNIEAAVDDAETKKTVAEQALEKAMEEAHKHFTSKQEIEDAKSDRLRKKVAQAKTALENAKKAFNQAKAKADKAAKDLEDAEQDTKDATEKKHAAKYELEQAQLQLELAQSNLRSAQGDLENAQKDARQQRAVAKKNAEQAEKELNHATRQLDTHNNKVTVATDKEADAHKKLTEAEAHHSSKIACQQGSQAALDEADAARRQAQYWSGHTEILEKEHYWDGEFGPIHQAADTILKDKSDEYDDAKSKNDKHIREVEAALQAMQAARQVKDQATDERTTLEAKTPLLQDSFVRAERKKNDATYRKQVADAIHEVYHK